MERVILGDVKIYYKVRVIKCLKLDLFIYGNWYVIIDIINLWGKNLIDGVGKIGLSCERKWIL